MTDMLSRNKNLKPVKKSMEDHAEDALYREISEEVQAQKTYDFVKKNLRLLIAGAILIVIATVCVQLVRYHRHMARDAQARAFESALTLADSGQYDAADEAFAKAAAKFSSGMGDLAMWESAMMDLRAGRPEPGIAKLEKIAADGASRDFQHLALIRLAVMRGDGMTGAEFEKFLSPVLTARSPFYYTGMLLVAQKYIASGEQDTANKWLDKVISDKDAPASISGMAESLR